MSRIEQLEAPLPRKSELSLILHHNNFQDVAQHAGISVAEQREALAQYGATVVGLLKEQQLAQQKLLEREAVRKAYLYPDNEDIAERVALLEAQGFTVFMSEDGSKIERLTWDTIERDSGVFAQLIEHLWATAHLDQEEFMYQSKDTKGRSIPSAYDKMCALLLGGDGEIGMSLFKRMDNDSIPRSRAHTENPARHSLTVAAFMNVDHMTSRIERVIARLMVLHDLGKLTIAFKDTKQNHAYNGAYIVEELIRRYLTDQTRLNMSEADAVPIAELVGMLVKYHHIFEVIEKGDITLEEFVQGLYAQLATMPFPEKIISIDQIEQKWELGQFEAADFMEIFNATRLLHQIANLTIADRLSVGGQYNRFAYSAVALSVSMARQLSSAEELVRRLDTVATQYFATITEILITFFSGQQIDEQAPPEDVKLLAVAVNEGLGNQGSIPLNDWTAWLSGKSRNPLEKYLQIR